VRPEMNSSLDLIRFAIMIQYLNPILRAIIR